LTEDEDAEEADASFQDIDGRADYASPKAVFIKNKKKKKRKVVRKKISRNQQSLIEI